MSKEHDTRPAERQAYDRRELTEDELADLSGGSGSQINIEVSTSK